MAAQAGRPIQQTIAKASPRLVAEMVSPELADEIGRGSHQRIEWRCPRDTRHGTYLAAVHGRTRSVKPSGCPVCAGRKVIEGLNDLGTLFPDLARDLVDPELAKKLRPGSQQPVLWKCAVDRRHLDYIAIVGSRTLGGSACPVCSGRTVQAGVNDLASVRPDLVVFLVEPSLATTLTAGSNRRVEWRCLVDDRHPIYVDSPNGMSKFKGRCAACTGQRLVPGLTDLKTTHPEVAASLVDVDLGRSVSAKSQRKLEWKCLADSRHSTWSTSVANRTAGTGCAVCSNKRTQAGINDLATTNPELAAQAVDQVAVTEVTARSERKLEWVCATVSEHRWFATVSNRTIGRGCPVCAKSGFKVHLPASFYVTVSADVDGLGEVVQYGVSNKASVRLGKHARLGFSRVPAMEVVLSGREALTLEAAVKARLASDGVLSCSDEGTAFDGSTESFAARQLALPAFLTLVRGVAAGLGLPLKGVGASSGADREVAPIEGA